MRRGVQHVGDFGAEMHFELKDLVPVANFDQVLAQPFLLHRGVLGVIKFPEIKVYVVGFKRNRGLVPVVAQCGHEPCDDAPDHLVRDV